ncbi:ferrochelatase [Gottschalkia purinilytica]|uniref:ferrochelatase n=1 Tax=Gottschalkia purinilytica TaxID=1503 RepID=UPI00067CB89F|nr:ferrochelatase [Gottschalkia purinilytica]
MAYDGMKSTIFLLISFYSLIVVVTNRDKLLEEKIKTIFCIVLPYILSVIFINVRDYNMDLNLLGNALKKDETAVILVYKGESERYSLSKEVLNIKNKNSLSEKIKIPFKLNKVKRNYNLIGKSDYKKETIRFSRELQKSLNENNYNVYIGYMNDNKYIEETIIDVANNGYKNVIVVPIFLTEDSNVLELKSRVENMKLFNLNINIKYTESLWNSKAVLNSYFNKIAKQIETDNTSDTGVVLIGGGEKDYNNEKYIQSIKEDTMFRNKLRLLLQKELNLQEHKVKACWFEYIDPKYEDIVRDMLEYGVSKILIVYTNLSVTDIENNIMADNIINNVEFPDGVSIKIIDGFIDDEKLVQELKNRIEFTNLQK